MKVSLAILLVADLAIFLFLLLYIVLLKVKKMDALLYKEDHSIHKLFKSGGIFLTSIRVQEYGLWFLLVTMAPGYFDKKYPSNVFVSEVPMRKRIPYIVVFVTGFLWLAVSMMDFVFELL